MRLAPLCAALGALFFLPAAAQTAQTLPLSQNWSDVGLISANNEWSAVPGFIAYRGDDLVTVTAVDPQTILADGSATPVNVIANQANPNTLSTGGVAEFEITNPVVAFQGSGTADAPHLVARIVTTGLRNIRVRYLLRDIDGSADNAVQPVALHVRAGTTGDFTNVPAAFVADASAGPALTLETPVDVVLPELADDQPSVDVRWMTTNAVGSDEWIGIDDIEITGSPLVSAEGTPAVGAALAVANPARAGAAVRLTLSAPAEGALAVYDALGRRVATLAAGALGTNVRAALPAGLAPGVYVLRLEAGAVALSRVVSVVR